MKQPGSTFNQHQKLLPQNAKNISSNQFLTNNLLRSPLKQDDSQFNASVFNENAKNSVQQQMAAHKTKVHKQLISARNPQAVNRNTTIIAPSL